MARRTIYTQITTDRTFEEIRQVTRSTLRPVGGTMQDTPTGLEIIQGANEIRFAFAAQFTSTVNIRQISGDKYEIECTIEWKPNGLFWICLIVGIFVLGILWIVPLLYLFIDPVPVYQQALDRVQGLLT